MNRKLTYYFLFSILAGSAIYGLQQFQIQLPDFIQFHINDFLIIPIVLTICLWVLRWSKNDKNCQISLPIILYLCTLYSILFEYILPNYHSRYTSDIIDTFLYFSNGFLFYKLQNNDTDK